MEKHAHTFRWIIENTSYCWHTKGNFLESPIFVANALHKSKWRLRIYPRGFVGASGFCPIYLVRVKNDDGPDYIKISYEFEYYDRNGAAVSSQRMEDRFIPRNDGYGFRKFVSQDLLFRHQKIELSCKIYTKDQPSSEGEYASVTTTIGKESISFTWKIQDFCNLTPISGYKFNIKSASIETLSLKFLLVEGLGCEECLCLEAESSDEKIRVQSIELFILDTTGKTIKCDLDERAYRTIDKRCLFPLRSSMKKLKKYRIGDALNLLCNISYSTGFVGHSTFITDVCSKYLNWPYEGFKSFGDSSNVKKQNKTSFWNGLESLYKDKAMSDVKLRTESEVFPCHKLILSAASPVFRSIFTLPMKEKDSEFVDIPDLEGCILHRMLLYLYSGTLDLSWETACKLYTVADKYQITNLKDKCGLYLKANMSVENACEGLNLADLHQDYELKRTIQNYILNHGTSIIKSEDWRKLMKTNCQLAAETMQLKYLT